MCHSRLAFIQEFELQLSSPALKEWFDAVRRRERTLADFSDPLALRRYLHSDERADPRKPEIWRTLVGELQAEWTPEAVTFVLGLLEPALGGLIDGFNSGDLDPDDLWQEAIRSALQALRNPRLCGRKEVLAGLVRDTFKYLCVWLRIEFSKAEDEAPLLDSSYEVAFGEALAGTDEETLFADWCRRCGVGPQDTALILITRVRGNRLSSLAPARSPAYDRLRRRRTAAQRRLKSWLQRNASGDR